jgi:hypothetical protein
MRQAAQPARHTTGNGALSIGLPGGGASAGGGGDM